MSTRPSSWQVRATVAVVALSVVATLLGLVRAGHYREPPALAAQYVAQDAAVLVVGVPATAVGLWAATRGSRRGHLVWLGSLAYMAYVWGSVGLQVRFNEFFLGYVALFSLSLFTLLSAVAAVDAEAVRDALADEVSERLYGGFLLAVAGGLAALWLAEVIPATLAGTAPPLVDEIGPQATVSHFLDLAVVVPALALAARWLLSARPWGYVFAGVGLVFGALLAPTILATTLVVLAVGEVTVPTVAVVLTVLPLVVAAALAVAYVRAAPRGDAEPAD
jgi:hypothetical protein